MRMSQYPAYAVVVLVLAAFTAGVLIGSSQRTVVEDITDEAFLSALTSRVGFSEALADIRGQTIRLAAGCRLIQFDVTPDQAYSISAALGNISLERPLTHDIFQETADNFGIKLLQATIDRHENGIYKSKIYFTQGSSLLALDARPSDAMALAARYGLPLYIKDSILEEQGVYTC